MRDYETKQGTLRRGLKSVHIGEDIWVFGRQKTFKDGRRHMVIYGPSNKEYHLWNEEIKTVLDYEGVNRHGNSAYEGLVKVYILTSILDDRKNWCFDLSSIPNEGKLKVALQNGTIRIIDFDGQFSSQRVGTRWPDLFYDQPIVAYRKTL